MFLGWQGKKGIRVEGALILVPRLITPTFIVMTRKKRIKETTPERRRVCGSLKVGV